MTKLNEQYLFQFLISLTLIAAVRHLASIPSRSDLYCRVHFNVLDLTSVWSKFFSPTSSPGVFTFIQVFNLSIVQHYVFPFPALYLTLTGALMSCFLG